MSSDFRRFRVIGYFFSLLFFQIAFSTEPEFLVPEIVRKFDHDPTAFTQGLAIANNRLYESTGLYGESSLRLLNPDTGKVLRRIPLPDPVFAEGIAIVSDRLLQLTWKEEQAFVYALPSLDRVDRLSYSGEGWGLCADGESIWTSDGSSVLTRRDPRTFFILNRIDVKINGKSVSRLNDLECTGNVLYANVWKEDRILRIDKSTGEVNGIVDASGLLSVSEREIIRSNPDAVLNGIAFRQDRNTFYVTGKYWPTLFEVRFVPVGIRESL